MERKNDTSLGVFGWLGIFILLGFFLFKWLPDWTWRPKTPEIEIREKGFFIDYDATWTGNTATIKRENPRDVYIKITPKDAVESRANLKVTVNGDPVEYNCDYKSEYFCYQIKSSSLKNGDVYEIVAKNDTGEKHATLKIISGEAAVEKKSESSSTSSSSSSSSSNSSTTNNSGSSNSSSPSSGTTTTIPTIKKSSSCLHYENGRCWDDYEDEMYSAGLYDKSYGYYGGSYMTPDGCDSKCQDILEDAYEEGYYENF